MQVTIRYLKVGRNKFFGKFPHEVEALDEKTVADLACKDLKVQHCCGLKKFFVTYNSVENSGEVYTIDEKKKSKPHQIIGHFEVLKGE